MEYRSGDFVSPTGYIMIFAKYNNQSKMLSFEVARGYLYPQDSKNSMYLAMNEHFMKDNVQVLETIDDANKVLENLNIEARFEI